MVKFIVKLSAIASFLLSINTFAVELLPADHSMCQANDMMMVSCQEGSEYLTANDGRCGCLKPTDYTDAQICIRAYISCPEEAPYVSLQRGTQFVGCGCGHTRIPGMEN